METPRMKEVLQGSTFPRVDAHNWKNMMRWKSSEGKPFILMSAPLKIDPTGKIDLYMNMALDISYPQKIITKFGVYFILFFLAFIFIFIIIGKIISQKALSSLYEMIKFTQHITASKLSNRIDHREWPKELKHLGHAFNSMMSNIESSFTHLGECTNELAHELRIPINNLIGSTEITLSRPRTVLEYQLLLETNIEDFRRLAKLSDNILFLAQPEVPGNVLNREKIDLEQEIMIVCEFYRTLANEKNIQIEYMLDKIELSTDRMLLQRALTNLLNNAIKYTQTKGRIILSTHSSDDFIEVKVSDNGIGIANEDIQSIFNRFYKLEACMSKSKNWGLGLAIVKKIMELNKGFVSVSSQIGSGSTFTLHFPKI